MTGFTQKTLSFVFMVFSAGMALADNPVPDAATPPPDIVFAGDMADLNEFVWTKRPLVVFADSPNDPRFIQQMAFITERLEDLDDRDVVVLTDTQRGQKTALREKLHPRGFMLVLIGKDGTIYLRKPAPWDVREISRVIDKMPMRQQEVRDRRGDS